MKLSNDQLLLRLARQDLAPVYLIAGDEVFFIQEALDAIRAAAEAAGFQDKVRYTVESGFDWASFRMMSRTASLLGDRQSIELRLTSTKLSEEAKTVLLDYVQRPPADKLLLLLADKLDAATQKANWVKAIEQKGVLVLIWPLPFEQMPQWIERRLNKMGLQAEPAAVELLATCTQGNLLAAAQEIDKLALLYPAGKLTLAQVHAASVDNARYAIFDLIDVVLQGNAQATRRVLRRLQEEGMEPILILWALTKELHLLLQLAKSLQQGQPMAQVLSHPAIFAKRKPGFSKSLKQHTLQSLQAVLTQAVYVDQVIKGAAVGNVWDALERMALAMAGFLIFM